MYADITRLHISLGESGDMDFALMRSWRIPSAAEQGRSWGLGVWGGMGIGVRGGARDVDEGG